METSRGTRGNVIPFEPRLIVTENEVLKRIHGPEREDLTRRWRKLHTEDILNLFSSPYITRAT
jgi:hypothetical protein